MTEPTTSLEAEAIAWGTNLVANTTDFQDAVGAVDVSTALAHIFESDAPPDLGSHAVVECDGGDLKRDGDAYQGIVEVTITVLLQPVAALSQQDQLRRARNVNAAIRAKAKLLGYIHIMGWQFKGPARMPASCPWPEWFGTVLTIRVLGSE